MTQAIWCRLSAVHVVVRFLSCANTLSLLRTWTQAESGPRHRSKPSDSSVYVHYNAVLKRTGNHTMLFNGNWCPTLDFHAYTVSSITHQVSSLILHTLSLSVFLPPFFPSVLLSFFPSFFSSFPSFFHFLPFLSPFHLFSLPSFCLFSLPSLLTYFPFLRSYLPS